MHAADAPGDEHADARELGRDHGPGHGGGADGSRGQHVGQIAPAHLRHLLRRAELFQFVRGQPHVDPALEDGDGGGHRAFPADQGLHVPRGLDVLRIGHAVGDDGGFQGHEGASLVHGFDDFLG